MALFNFSRMRIPESICFRNIGIGDLGLKTQNISNGMFPNQTDSNRKLLCKKKMPLSADETHWKL